MSVTTAVDAQLGTITWLGTGWVVAFPEAAQMKSLPQPIWCPAEAAAAIVAQLETLKHLPLLPSHAVWGDFCSLGKQINMSPVAPTLIDSSCDKFSSGAREILFAELYGRFHVCFKSPAKEGYFEITLKTADEASIIQTLDVFQVSYCWGFI